jgi:hypothetical protein
LRNSILTRSILVLIIILALPVSAHGAKGMSIQASFNPIQTDQGFEATISGRVFDDNNQSVSNAVVSIQVINPQGTSDHVAIAYSTQTGQFQDTFLLRSNSPGGNYTTFLVADKPGYDTARLTLTFAFSSPDFLLEIFSNSLSIQQGQSATLTLTVLSLRGYNQPVNLTAMTQSGVNIQFNPTSVVPSATTIVSFSVAYDAQPGNHTITLLGVSGSLTHRVSIELNIVRGPMQTILSALILIGIIVTVSVLTRFFRRSRSQRHQREAVVEELIKQASGDFGYVATARAIARLEELRALGKVDEATYQKLKKEYEKRLEKSK